MWNVIQLVANSPLIKPKTGICRFLFLFVSSDLYVEAKTKKKPVAKRNDFDL